MFPEVVVPDVTKYLLSLFEGPLAWQIILLARYSVSSSFVLVSERTSLREMFLMSVLSMIW